MLIIDSEFSPVHVQDTSGPGWQGYLCVGLLEAETDHLNGAQGLPEEPAEVGKETVVTIY